METGSASGGPRPGVGAVAAEAQTGRDRAGHLKNNWAFSPAKREGGLSGRLRTGGSVCRR